MRNKYSSIFLASSEYSNIFECLTCNKSEYEYIFEAQNIQIFEYSNIRAHPCIHVIPPAATDRLLVEEYGAVVDGVAGLCAAAEQPQSLCKNVI